ncbi:TonB-dependent receptor plug domain-containing protein [Aquiflexum sp.]|uniref:TonB-dependent receptor plug domain-containing protein n=1 Tax=Aquiflexum sp. TaxID=1872584 RepID=UPI00359325E7
MKKNIQRQLIMFSKRLLYGFIIQLFFCTVLIANDSNAQRKTIDNVKVNIALKEKPVSAVFDLIESTTDFRFTYNDNMVDFNQSITIVERNRSVYKVLEEISKQTQMNFVQVNDNIHVNYSKRQNIKDRITILRDDVTVSGSVKDNNGDPIPGVSVIIEGTTSGTVTDLDGNYTLEVPEGGVLLFSFIGFERQRISIDNRTIIDVTLIADFRSLDEVIVIGYGLKSRRLMTESIGTMGSKEINQIPVASVDQAIQGRISGVQVTSVDGTPGAPVAIRIRGVGTVGNTQPLFVIDGVPVGNNASATTNPLATINPADIESVSVLKDASAAAVYGVRAANGVVLITTKRGTKGKPKVTLDSYHGVQQIARFNEYNTTDE